LPLAADRCPFSPRRRPPPAWNGATAAAGRARAKAPWEEEERRTRGAPRGPWTRAADAERWTTGSRAPPYASARRPAREPAAPPSGTGSATVSEQLRAPSGAILTSHSSTPCSAAGFNYKNTLYPWWWIEYFFHLDRILTSYYTWAYGLKFLPLARVLILELCDSTIKTCCEWPHGEVRGAAVSAGRRARVQCEVRSFSALVAFAPLPCHVHTQALRVGARSHDGGGCGRAGARAAMRWTAA
jgi:hypothetical protein